MDFLLPPELVEFKGTLRKFFNSHITSKFLRQFLQGAPEPKVLWDKDKQRLWKQLAETGALMAPIPEEFDGLGFGLLSAQVIAQEAGRALVPLPVFETISLGIVPLGILATKEHQEKLLSKVGQGALRLTGAFEE